MQTTLSQQILAIQDARSILSETRGDELSTSSLDRGLNDAGATLAALNLILKRFRDEPDESVKTFEVLKFFHSLDQATKQLK